MDLKMCCVYYILARQRVSVSYTDCLFSLTETFSESWSKMTADVLTRNLRPNMQKTAFVLVR